MPVEHALWKLGEKAKRLPDSRLQSEKDLEDLICDDISILNENWLLIGRQVSTAFGKLIDLLALDRSGSLIVIELKKEKTPREVVAQVLDYGSWARNLDETEIAEIYDTFNNGQKSLNEAFREKFGFNLDEDTLNDTHQLLIVAAEVDSSTERIVNYLSDFNIAINVAFFRIFQDGDSKFLSRAWFIDPSEIEEKAHVPKSQEPWNGEFYVSFGEGKNRAWEEAIKYGFISAGGGRWYSKTLYQLKRGDRIWVNVPATGYVAVGEILDSAVKYDEFEVITESGKQKFQDIATNGEYHREYIEDEEKAEYFVRVKWLKTVSLNAAVSEVGFFGNQNTVCKPTTSKWPHTVERLKIAFDIHY